MKPLASSLSLSAILTICPLKAALHFHSWTCRLCTTKRQPLYSVDLGDENIIFQWLTSCVNCNVQSMQPAPCSSVKCNCLREGCLRGCEPVRGCTCEGRQNPLRHTTQPVPFLICRLIGRETVDLASGWPSAFYYVWARLQPADNTYENKVATG